MITVINSNIVPSNKTYAKWSTLKFKVTLPDNQGVLHKNYQVYVDNYATWVACQDKSLPGKTVHLKNDGLFVSPDINLSYTLESDEVKCGVIKSKDHVWVTGNTVHCVTADSLNGLVKEEGDSVFLSNDGILHIGDSNDCIKKVIFNGIEITKFSGQISEKSSANPSELLKVIEMPELSSLGDWSATYSDSGFEFMDYIRDQVATGQDEYKPTGRIYARFNPEDSKEKVDSGSFFSDKTLSKMFEPAKPDSKEKVDSGSFFSDKTLSKKLFEPVGPAEPKKVETSEKTESPKTSVKDYLLQSLLQANDDSLIAEKALLSEILGL